MKNDTSLESAYALLSKSEEEKNQICNKKFILQNPVIW